MRPLHVVKVFTLGTARLASGQGTAQESELVEHGSLHDPQASFSVHQGLTKKYTVSVKT